MAIVEMETNSDIRSKKRKKSERGSLKKLSAELSDANQEDAPREIPSVPASLEKKRKSKRLKLTDPTSESVEVIHKESETSLNSASNKKTKILDETSVIEPDHSESIPSQDSLTSQSKKKKKKGKKSQVSVSDSVRSNCESTPSATKSKKKKWKKKKLKKKNESTNSPAKTESSHNSNAACRSEKAISYLETWKNDRKQWKFEKLTQFWLCKNMFDENMVPEAAFATLLEYFVDLQGNTKNFVVELCEGIFKKKEEMAALEKGDEVLERAYERARSIIQCLR